MGSASTTKNGEKWVELPISGMSCASCAAKIESTLSASSAVLEAHVSFGAERVRLRLSESASCADPVGLIEGLGFKVGLRREVLRAREELSAQAVEAIQAEILELEAKTPATPEQQTRLKALHDELEALEAKRRIVPYIDPYDLRYNYFVAKPEPNTKAVMFCLMDVSGSMGEREKDLAKRFFMLLHLFLQRRYERTDIVFIRHTHEAKEVDEEAFFYSRESGGTVVSTALREMRDVLKERYPAGQWNIYAAQASDGENYSGDSDKCVQLLSEALMPVCQYYAYVEILDERESEIFQDESRGAELWRAYRRVTDGWPNFAMKRISRPADIYPVFRELFATRRQAA